MQKQAVQNTCLPCPPELQPNKLLMSSHTETVIGNLPDELLAEIFVMLLFHCGISSATFHINVQRVCHRWRDIVLSTPRLWAKFRVIFSHYCSTKLAIIEKHLELARRLPLDIEVRFLDALDLRPTRTQDAILHTLNLKAFQRCRTLRVFRHPESFWILPLRLELPVLEGLYVTPREGRGPRGMTGVLEKPSNTPRLRSFMVEDTFLSWSARWPFRLRVSQPNLFGASLTSLHLTHAFDQGDAVSLVMASPQLRTLHWKYPPHTRSNNQLEAPNPLILDFLEDLRVFGDAHRILTHLYAPNLVTFGHGDPQPGDIRDEGIFGPEARFPSLRHMTLVGSHHTSAEDLRRLFRNHPLLERVKFPCPFRHQMIGWVFCHSWRVVRSRICRGMPGNDSFPHTCALSRSIPQTLAFMLRRPSFKLYQRCFGPYFGPQMEAFRLVYLDQRLALLCKSSKQNSRRSFSLRRSQQRSHLAANSWTRAKGALASVASADIDKLHATQISREVRSALV